MYDEAACIAACRHISREIVRPLIAHYSAGPTLAISTKDDESLVTEADRTLEKRIRDYLEAEFPAFGIVGEELPPRNPHADYVWTVDPIDGTESFVAGLALFGTLLAVVDQREPRARKPLLGAIYMPLQDELAIGNGVVTTLNGKPVTMRAPQPQTRMRLLLGDLSETRRKIPRARYDRLLELVPGFRSTHTWGDCYGYLALLTGKAHARVDFDLGVDDIGPVEPVIAGAGGMVSTLEGESLSAALSALDDLGERGASFDIACSVTAELQERVLSAAGPAERRT